MLRKDFLRLGSFLAASTQINLLKPHLPSRKNNSADKEVDFLYDGIQLYPADYAKLLMQLADEGKIKADNYSNGGVVEELEHKFASLLGKESAVWMPTGTLANHIAIRHLAGEDHRVILQEQSHFYNDSGDCAQNLSNLNLIPLGENAVEFTLDDVKEVVDKTNHGRVETRIGVLAIETPVRRQYDRGITYDNLKNITNYAREQHFRTHLDGARLFIQSAHTGIESVVYSTLFDTVYISMWKCFNAPSGAILAGTKSFTEKLFHERRMFGGGLPAAWPFAAVALHYADSFFENYNAAWQNAELLFEALIRTGKCKIIPFENGTHIVKLELNNVNAADFKNTLANNKIQLPNPIENTFFLKVNPSINRIKNENLIGYFTEALGI